MTAQQRAAVFAIVGRGDEPPDPRLRLAWARAQIREQNVLEGIRQAILADVQQRDGRIRRAA
jgi:hypothetical protein